jgi:hypothetical protein
MSNKFPPIPDIQNGEEGGLVREKLNALIDQANQNWDIADKHGNHLFDKDNPHDVKAPQVGLEPALEPIAPDNQNVQGALEFLLTRMASATVSDAMPKDPEPGDIWIDTATTMEMYVYIEGNGWISMTGAGGAGGSLPGNITIDDMDGTLTGKLLGREPGENGRAFWRPIYTDDVLTRGAQPMFRKPNGQFAKKTDPEAVRDQQTANWFLYESMMDLNGGVQVSEDAPVNPNDGALWFDNTEEIMQLFLYHEDSDAWIPVAPPTTIEGRVREGEATQQEIIKQINISLEEQTAIRNKVAEIDKTVDALEPVDISGLATIEYVDDQDSQKLGNSGVNQLPDEADWKIRQESGSGNKTLMQVKNGALGLYNVREPSEPHHAATRQYADGKLNKTGGTVTGDIAMNGNKITALADPVADAQAATKGYVDRQVTSYKMHALWRYKNTLEAENLSEGEFTIRTDSGVDGGSLRIYIAGLDANGRRWYAWSNDEAQYSHGLGAQMCTITDHDGEVMKGGKLIEATFNNTGNNYARLKLDYYKGNWGLSPDKFYTINAAGLLPHAHYDISHENSPTLLVAPSSSDKVRETSDVVIGLSAGGEA